jgi:RNA recognition motif-containing protein
MTRTKVFVGNLSFKTKREELAAEFQAAGRVVEANIITRGTRSLGYGFVEMESEDDASKAINIMNKKSIDNREINVELAKPRDETKIGERRPAPQRRNRRPNNPSGGNGGNGGTSPNSSQGAPRENNRDNNRDNNAGGSNPANTSGNKRQKPIGNKPNNAPATSDSPKEGGSSPNNSGSSSGSSSSSKDGGDRTPGARRFRPRRYRRRFPRKDLPPRKESETSLFIANLPFSIDSPALNDLYKAYNVKSAHVVANRNGKSKGFGFVELATQADQKAALDATNKTNVQGRELIVKIALTPVEVPKDAQGEVQAVKEEQKN